jgi:riboflavin synthase
MFTGIIETTGTIKKIEKDRTNIHFTLKSSIGNALKIDQSVSHDGVCLTVVAVEDDTHTVTAIDETLKLTSLAGWKVGKNVNLERCMLVGARLDGHIVQGHVDAKATCIEVLDENGSWRYTFQYQPSPEHLLVNKGSVCINGVSLTVVQPKRDLFSVAIIPYTWEHTNFQFLKAGDVVNLEFDIIGKYIARYQEYMKESLA